MELERVSGPGTTARGGRGLYIEHGGPAVVTAQNAYAYNVIEKSVALRNPNRVIFEERSAGHQL